VWALNLKIEAVQQVLEDKVRMDRGGWEGDPFYRVSLPSRETAGRDFLEVLSKASRKECQKMVEHFHHAQGSLCKLLINIGDQEAVDAGGVTRAVVEDCCDYIRHHPEEYGLRLVTGGGDIGDDAPTSLYFAVTSSLPEETLRRRYLAIGRLMGIGVGLTGATLSLDFAPAVYKVLFGQKLTFADFTDIDATAAGSVLQIAAFDIETFNSLALEWAVTTSANTLCPLDPKRWSADAIVRYEHRMRYLRKKIEFCLGLGPHLLGPMKEFVLGFSDVVGRDIVSVFTWDEMKLVLEGERTIDVENMLYNTQFVGTAEAGGALHLHWVDTLRRLSAEQLLLLLRFWTGTSRPPAGGFSELSRPLVVKGDPPSSMLPRAATCFFAITIPDYGTREEVEAKLIQAITETGAADFGFE
jgi:E3 ubiquitin-protein ligase HUWE1